ncbi:hypothetical protein ACFOVU_04770 [Nocardiopsis sediminis]|uniref:HEAT repeat domain-containing protein n=1 Tax=Nocardiopsis sediminis TaxID=1778267 RepID=A0ABV8FIL5_9ACTN
MTAEQRSRNEETFVPGPDYHHAQSLLSGDSRTVILSGRPGSGRRTAAMALLGLIKSGRPEQGVVVRELPDEQVKADEPAGKALQPDSIEQGQRLLLDLTADQDLLSRIRPFLETFRHEVQTKDGYFVVVIDQGQEDEVRDEFGDLLVSWRSPNGVAVLEKHLRVHGVGIDAARLNTHEAAKWAATARLGEIAHLARLARDARLASPDTSAESCLTEAHAALADRGAEVIRAVNGLSDSWQRAVLLAAALLDGRNVDAVFTAAKELMTVLATSTLTVPPLERTVFPSQLDRLGVSISSDRTVRFAKLGYAAAVRDCFWDGHPDLSQEFVAWVDRCVRSPRMAPADRDAVAGHFADQCVRLSRLESLFGLVRQWASDPSQGRSLALQAALALGRVLATPEAGRAARREVYHWAKEKPLPAELGQVLVAVCVDVIADRQPDEALVRLHYLARRGGPAVRGSAMEALHELMSARPDMYRLMIKRLAERAGADKDVWGADRELLWWLTEPERLTASRRGRQQAIPVFVRANLVTALADALHDDNEMRRHVGRALQTEMETGGAGALLGLLVEAGGGARRLSSVYGAARRWALNPDEVGERGAKARAALTLIRRIDRAQGWDDGVEERAS